MRPLRVCTWTGESIAESFGFRKALDQGAEKRTRRDEFSESIAKIDQGHPPALLFEKDGLENGRNKEKEPDTGTNQNAMGHAKRDAHAFCPEHEWATSLRFCELDDGGKADHGRKGREHISHHCSSGFRLLLWSGWKRGFCGGAPRLAKHP